MRRTRAVALGATLAASVVLAACGADDNGDNGDANGNDGEMEDITLGLIPIIDVAPVYVGMEQGFFEEEGIELEISSGQGGAAIVPGVVSGEMDFGFGNSQSLLIAVDGGLPLRVVASGVYSTGDPEEDGFTVISADPNIQGPEDLGDTTVAVNTVNAIGDTVVMASAEQAGVDPDSITFVEMPFSSMNASLEAGDIDAAWQVEPFVTLAEDDGAHVVTNVLMDLADEFEISTFFATEDYANDNPDTVDAFVTAVNRSLEYSSDNPDEVRAILPEYLEIDEELADRVILPGWQPSVSRSTFELYRDLSIDRGLISEDFDIEPLLSEAE